MPTSLKALIFNVCGLLIGAVVIVGVIRWWETPKSEHKLVIEGPTQANLGDVVNFSVKQENKPYWLGETYFEWSVLKDNQPVDFRQMNNNTIVLGTGLTPANFKIYVGGIALYNPFWVHPSLYTLPSNYSPMIVGNGPSPNPNPNPNPSPTNSVWVLAIFDPDQSTLNAAQKSIFNSTTIETPLTAINANWHVYNTVDMVPTTNNNVSPVSKTKWGKAAIAVGLPALVIINNNGGVIKAIPLPQSEQAIVQTVQANRG